MSNIRFTMKDLDGTVMPYTSFVISTSTSTNAASFTTNLNGQATVSLSAVSTPYYISKQDGTTESVIAYKFFVPDTTYTLDAELLFVDMGKISKDKNDKSIAALIEAKVVAVNAANRALQVVSLLGDVSTIRNNLDSLVQVAGSIENVDTVANNIESIVSASEGIASISSILPYTANIATIANRIEPLVAVGNNINNINDVRAMESDIAAIADNIASITDAAAAVTQAIDAQKDLYIAGTHYTKGVSATLNLSYIPAKTKSVKVFFDGIYQNKNTFARVGTAITFNEILNVDTVEIHYEVPSQFVGLDDDDNAVLVAAQNAAQASANAAAASFDSFDDRYLGAKSVAPIVDNDGNTLLVGAKYFNSTENKMYFRNSANAWQWDTADASSVNYLPAGTGAVATDVQSKLRESVSVKDFGAVGDGVVSDQSAFVLARDNGKAYFIPSGNYDLPSAFDSRNTPIISLGASIDKGVPASTYLRSFLDIGKKAIYRQSIRGTDEYSSTPTTYSYITDLVSLDIRHHNGAGYQQFFNNDSGGRTAVPAIYIDGSHFGYGDVPGVSVHYGISRHPDWATISGNWTGANSIVCFDGDVQALTPNVNVYGAEYHLGDNANDKVAANGIVLDFARNNGNPSVGGAYNTVWTGVRLQTSGTYAADSGLSISGKWNVGIDFSGATLTNNAAIALKTNDRIYFGVPAVAPPLWHANTLSNTYISFDAGSLNFVNAGITAFKIESTAVTSTPEHKFINSMNFVGSGYIANTVGAAGGAAVLPAAPFTYLKIKIDGAVYKIPVYNN